MPKKSYRKKVSPSRKRTYKKKSYVKRNTEVNVLKQRLAAQKVALESGYGQMSHLEKMKYKLARNTIDVSLAPLSEWNELILSLKVDQVEL